MIVTSDDASLPDGCHPRQVAELVISFVDAFNSGDQAVLSRIFFLSEGPSPPDFSDGAYDPWSWYTVGEIEPSGKIVGGFVTYDQRELLRLLRQEARTRASDCGCLRVSLGRLVCSAKRTTSASSTSSTGPPETSNPASADPRSIASGQGAINCKNRRIFTWRMDMRAGDQRTSREAANWLCTDPPGWKPGKAVVACA